MRSLSLLVMVLLAPQLWAQEDAKTLFDKGTAAYALGNYDEAAKDYEAAFKVKPDPALLYNAAQAHRLAGNKPRALQLYQSYLRLYAKGAKNRPEVEKRIEELKAAIENDRAIASAPPTETQPLPGHGAPLRQNPGGEPATTGSEPTTGAPPTTSSTTPTGTATTNAPASETLTASAPPREQKPLVKKAWFWGVIGGAVVVAVGVGLGVGLGVQPRNPSSTLTNIPVN